MLVFGVFAVGTASGGLVGAIIGGVMGVLAGVVVLIWPGIVALRPLYVMAFWAIFTGVAGVVAAVSLRRETEG